jgi:replicative DNA helicase
VVEPEDPALDDEIALRAARQRRANLRSIPDGLHIADIQDTDTSDRRRYHLGIRNIDVALGPLLPGGFTLLAALTGKGKTIFAEQVAVANAVRYSVLFATLEQTGEEVRDSIIARAMGLSLQDAEREMRDRSDAYRAARDRLLDMNLHLWRPAPRQPRTPQRIFAAAERYKADLLIVDYTRRIDGWVAGHAANEMAKWFSEAVKETKIHLLLLAQLKFKSGKFVGMRPTEDDIADSTQLPQEADKTLFLHRPFFGHKTRDGVTEVICPKNRKGRVFTSHVTWYGPTRSLYAMDELEEAACECCKPKKKARAEPEPPPPRDESELTRAEEDALLAELPF